MEIKEMMEKLWGAPAGKASGIEPDVFGGVRPEPPKNKNDAFGPQILSQAQKSYGGGMQGQGPNNQGPPTRGTVGNLIPPGWSSQAKED